MKTKIDYKQELIKILCEQSDTWKWAADEVWKDKEIVLAVARNNPDFIYANNLIKLAAQDGEILKGLTEINTRFKKIALESDEDYYTRVAKSCSIGKHTFTDGTVIENGCITNRGWEKKDK